MNEQDLLVTVIVALAFFEGRHQAASEPVREVFEMLDDRIHIYLIKRIDVLADERRKRTSQCCRNGLSKG